MYVIKQVEKRASDDVTAYEIYADGTERNAGTIIFPGKTPREFE